MSRPSSFLGRLPRLIAMAALISTALSVSFWTYAQMIVRRQLFNVEARLMNSEGRIALVPLNRRADNAKCIDEMAASAAVLIRSGLWIKHLVMSGDREYAFCPFGRVYVLRGVSIDESEVESVQTWNGEPQDYPFPKAGES